MIKLAPFESCTGCTACMNSCSHNAIVMAEDAEVWGTERNVY